MKKIRVLVMTITMALFAVALMGCGTTAVNYTLNFESNGGSIIDSLSTDGESRISMPNNPTKEGFYFDGWYWDNDIWEQQVTVDSLVDAPISSDMTVYAKWTEDNSFTIIFNSNGGSSVDSVSIDAVSTILLPNDPTKSGFEFDGWYWDDDIWAQQLVMGHSLMDAPSSNNLTVYAKWTEDNSFTIVFNSNDGSSVDSVNVDAVSTILLPNNPTKEGFEFDGWYWDDDIWAQQLIMGHSLMDAPSPNDLTVYAKWIEIEMYSIIFDSNGGNIIELISTDGMSTILMPNNPTKEGFEFDGWYKDEDVWAQRLLMEDLFVDVPASNEINLYAKWIEIKIYTIIFDSNSGNIIESISTDGMSTILMPSNPTKEGFEFDGWYKDEDVWAQRLLMETLFDSVPASNEINLYAKWIEITYTVTLEVNGGYPLESNTIQLSLGDDYSLPVATNLESIFFKGWFTELVDGTEIDISGQWIINQDTTLYATWSPYERDNDFIYFGSYPQTIKASDISITSTIPNNDGYYLGSDDSRYAKIVSNPKGQDYKFSDNTNVVEGNTYYFKVEPIKWRILEETNGIALILCIMAIDNHIYDDNSNSYEESDIRAWLNNEFYNNAFSDLHKTLIETTYVDNSAATTSDPNTTFASADTFDNIFLMSYQDMLNTGYGFNSSPANEDPARKILVTDYARSKGGVMSTHNMLNYYGKGYLWLRSPNLTSTAHFVEYNGWVGNSPYHYDSYEVAPVLRIQFGAISSYTLTLDNHEGVGVETITTKNHSEINSPTEPTKENYTFGGWYYDDETFANAVEFPFTINEDITVYAKWITLYALTFNSDGGTAFDTIIEDSDTEINAPTEPIKGDYTFRGWFYEESFTNAVIFPIIIDDFTTIYAKWTLTETTPYERINYSGNTDTAGSYILFGEYPQTLKASSVTITNTTPNGAGYYLGSDGERYAMVVATPYIDISRTIYTFGDGSDIINGSVYYFKVEPIKWRILEENNGTALILCEMLIDNHRYDDDSNNYEESEIRTWLNDEFYNTAFNEYQKEIIEITLVDNSVSTTIFPDINTYTCNDTNDMIFFMSYLDMKRAGYGFNSDPATGDEARMRLTTDYTRSIGAFMHTDISAYYGNGFWWLRTPYYFNISSVDSIYYHGINQFQINVDSTSMGGIVPAIRIKLN